MLTGLFVNPSPTSLFVCGVQVKATEAKARVFSQGGFSLSPTTQHLPAPSLSLLLFSLSMPPPPALCLPPPSLCAAE